MIDSRFGPPWRGVLAVLAASTTLFVGETAARADDREQCATAADQAQQLRDEGKYRRSREQLLVCARDVCPAPIKRDCLDWLTQVENTAPTVVFGAKDGPRDLSDVKVYVDGTVVTERLDGKPVQMDLGKHTVKFDYQGQTKEEEVIIGAGQKNRNVTVTFGAAGTAAPTPGSPATPTPGADEGTKEGSLVPAFIVGGIGVVALGSFAVFGLGGKSDVSTLEKECKPNCAQSDVDSARTKLIIADISLGVGVVALGVATYMILTRPKVDAEVKTARSSAPPKPVTGMSSVKFDFGALTGGAMGSVGARF
jgi:hypothetical protein